MQECCREAMKAARAEYGQAAVAEGQAAKAGKVTSCHNAYFGAWEDASGSIVITRTTCEGCAKAFAEGGKRMCDGCAAKIKEFRQKQMDNKKLKIQPPVAADPAKTLEKTERIAPVNKKIPLKEMEISSSE